MRVLIICCIILTFGCETKSVYKHYSEKQIKVKSEQSQILITKRKDLLRDVTLEQKAALFEKYIFKGMHEKYKFAPKLYLKGLPGQLRMDMTALFLSSLAYKFKVTKSLDDKEKIIFILDSIFWADESNGLDGFIPYKVKIEKNELNTDSNETHINVYTQLLFAYIPLLQLSEDRDIKDKVLRHLKLIIRHLQKSNFTLVNHLGQEVEYSDLSPRSFTLQSNRQQLLLVFIDLAQKYQLGHNLDTLRNKLRDMGYENKIQSMHFKILNLEFPTHSSSWLNLSNSYIGYLINREDYYRTAYSNLYRHYIDENNLLFILMSHTINPVEGQLKFVREKLKEFPINPTNHEVINSKRPEISVEKNAAFVKLKRELEVKSSLPFYQRPMRSFEWKLNQMRVDGNFKSNGSLNYTGIDYLIAYWMLRWLEKNYPLTSDK